jgi:hypothetical protein
MLVAGLCEADALARIAKQQIARWIPSGCAAAKSRAAAREHWTLCS